MDELPYHKPQTTKFYHDTLTSANISPSQCEKSCSRQYNVSITCVAAAQRRRRQGRRAEAGTVMAWSPTPTTRGRTRRRPAQRGWRGGARRDAGAAPGGGRRRGGGDVCSGGGTGGRSDGGERGGAQDDEGGGGDGTGAAGGGDVGGEGGRSPGAAATSDSGARRAGGGQEGAGGSSRCTICQLCKQLRMINPRSGSNLQTLHGCCSNYAHTNLDNPNTQNRSYQC